MTVYDVLNRLDKDIECCDETIRRSRRKKTIYSLVRATERKKALTEIRSFILINH